MSKLIILSGLPGSGKSTYAKKLSEEYKRKGNDTYIISSDEIRESLGGRQDFSHEGDVWEEFYNQGLKYSRKQNNVVIMDATFLTNKKRYNYALFFKNYYHSIELIIIDTPYILCCARNKNRNADQVVPDDVMKSMKESFEPIDTYTCFSYFKKVERVNLNI